MDLVWAARDWLSIIPIMPGWLIRSIDLLAPVFNMTEIIQMGTIYSGAVAIQWHAVGKQLC